MAERDPLLETTADLGSEAPPSTPEEMADFQAVARVLASASPLSRTYCPSPQDLIATDRVLGTAKALLRQGHIAACPLCRDDLADFRALEVIPEPALAALKAKIVLGLRAAKEAVGQALELIETSLTTASAPVIAVRSATAAPPIALRVAFGDGELELCWQADEGGVHLQVQADGCASKAYRLALSPQPTDEQGERWTPGVWESRSSDDNGRTSISGLATGNYVLTVYGPQRRQPDVEVELSLQD